jgi:hypothetical protein
MDLVLRRGRLWVAIAGRHDPRTGATLRGGAIAAVDPRTGRVSRVMRISLDPTDLAYGFGSLWVIGAPTKGAPRGVLRIDPSSGRVMAAIRTGASRIAATSRAVWVGGPDYTPGTPKAPGVPERTRVRFVYKIDPSRNAIVRRVLLPGGKTVLDLDAEAARLWISGHRTAGRDPDRARRAAHEDRAILGRRVGG